MATHFLEYYYLLVGFSWSYAEVCCLNCVVVAISTAQLSQTTPQRCTGSRNRSQTFERSKHATSTEITARGGRGRELYYG